MNTNLSTLTNSAPLYCRYPSQSQPQSAHIEITAEGQVTYEYNSEIGNAVPASVWHGTTRRIAIPNDLTPEGYAKLHEDITPIIQRIIDGLDSEWNGSNHIGTLTEDATCAEAELESFLTEIEGYPRCMIVDAADWLINDTDITHESNPEDILAAARCNVGGDFADIHIEGLESYLESLNEE